MKDLKDLGFADITPPEENQERIPFRESVERAQDTLRSFRKGKISREEAEKKLKGKGQEKNIS